MNKLKPCPFCGGEALLFGSYEHGYFVECHDCLAKTSNYGSEGMAESIAAWNTRAERTCHLEERHGDRYCTNCGEMVGSFDPLSELFIDGNAIEEWHYCPSCGAKVVDA